MKKFGGYSITLGDSYDNHAEQGTYTTGLNVTDVNRNTWSNRIECYGLNPHSAQKLSMFLIKAVEFYQSLNVVKQQDYSKLTDLYWEYDSFTNTYVHRVSDNDSLYIRLKSYSVSLNENKKVQHWTLLLNDCFIDFGKPILQVVKKFESERLTKFNNWYKDL